MNIYTGETKQVSIILPRLKAVIGILIAWLGLEYSTRLPWSARLPGVIIASLLLMLLISGIGIPTHDVYLVLILPLLGVPATLLLKRNR